MTILNAFQSVRPRGPDVDIPTAQHKKGAGKPLTVNTQKALDRAGRAIVELAPRTTGGIVIQSRAQSAAQLAKSRRISKAGTK